MEIATAVGGALLSSAFQVLLERFTSVDLINYARDGRVIDELNKWERILKKIYAVLDDAEDKQMTNRSVKMWVSELRDLAYDVEDVLDGFATEVQQRKIENEPVVATTSKLRKLIPTCVGVNPSIVKFNADMMSKIKSISKKLDEIMEIKDLLPLGEVAKVKSSQWRETLALPTTSLVSEAKVYGRDEDCQAILNMLKVEASYAAQVYVISIVGMGGLGKTTLAKLIFRDPSLDFDMKAWVSVGEDFDVFRMTLTLLHSLDEMCDYKDLNLLQVKLKEKLSKKKFLIVLDDVWTKNYNHWTFFTAPFEEGALGSKIIVTTRDHGVSRMMGAAQIYPLKELSYNDCLSVFAQHALGAKDFDNHLDLKEIGEAIVRRCQGLPLAAKAVGGLLRGKPDCNIWEQVLNSKIWEDETGMLPALRLSYYHLPSHLKQCFAYCAIFPNNYEFEKKELVLLWMAEGFLQQQKGKKQPKDVGYEYFDDLLSRLFFQESSGNKSQYVMHDLIRDLAQSVSEEICFNLDELCPAKSYANVRHSSFTRQLHEISQRFQVFHEMKRLRTFLSLGVLGTWDMGFLSRDVLIDVVPKLKFLRVLSLSSYELRELPNSMGDLKHLRYLNLSYTGLRRLPTSFSKLFNLQTLKLCECHQLVELPSDIDNLVNLQHLDIRGTTNLRTMPLKISCLTNLHTLSKFTVEEDKRLQLRELRKFSHLEGQLHITGLQNVVNIQDAELANLTEKRGIDNLELEWSAVSQNENAAMQVLKLLQPHTNLASLSITSYSGTIFPSWLGDPSYNTMVQVQLHCCHKITSLPPMGQLPLLRDLSIRGMAEVKEVGAEFCGNGCASNKACFPSLETLNIEDLYGWESWSLCNHDVNEKFPKLRVLSIKNCSVLVGKLPTYLPSLELLYVWCCIRLTNLPVSLPSLRALGISDCGQELVKRVRDFTSLKAFNIFKIRGLANLDEMHMQTLVAVEQLEIQDCGELKYLWDDVHNKLSSLKNLQVYNCEQLTSLVEGEDGVLPCNLQVLNIQACGQLKQLPDGLSSLTSLRHLSIGRCGKLVSLPASGLPYSLQSLRIRDCDSFESLSRGNDRDQSCHIEELEIRDCPSLQSISIGAADLLKTLRICCCTTQLLESLSDGLSHLTVLELNGCSMLESFPEGGIPIPALMTLAILECENLRSLPNHMHRDLASLRQLRIYKCKSLMSFPGGGLPPNLISLSVSYCDNLTQPISEWRLYNLTSLEILAVLGSCPSTILMISFPDDDDGSQLLLPTSLTCLYMSDFPNLKSISRGIQHLTCLKEIEIWNCPKLKSFPKDGFPATVGYLRMSCCPLMKKRCLKDKGVFWPVIAHIPYLSIC